MGDPDCDRSVLSTTNSILCHDTRVTICRDKPSSYNSRGAANSPFSLWLFAGSRELRRAHLAREKSSIFSKEHYQSSMHSMVLGVTVTICRCNDRGRTTHFARRSLATIAGVTFADAVLPQLVRM
jgi:hypothetical protein